MAGKLFVVGMKTVVISEPGGPEVLKIDERERPEVGPSQVRIRVSAAGLNRADLMQREGRYPAPPGVPGDVPGLEVAGVVESCGNEVERWQTGDAVCALLAGGGYAEFVAVEAAHCLPIPQAITQTEAATIPEAVFTVWSNVFQRGGLGRGERFLVHGGSSGIGLTAIQLANARGALVFATAGTAEKCAACERMGARRAINYRETAFEEALQREGVDVILDMVGGDYLGRNLQLLRPEGRLVMIAVMGGARAELSLVELMSRRLHLTGSTLRGRDDAFKAALAQTVEAEVWPLIAEGRFQPTVFATFPVESVVDAHRLMESNRHIGKIVLTFP